MTRKQIIKELKKYFDIRELVSPDVYKFRGELAWGEFDTRLLETLLALRKDILKVPIVVNNWASGGKITQRGFRENICQLIKEKTLEGKIYMTPHVGMAVDFSSPKMSADEMREKITANAAKLPHPIRLEKKDKAPTWVHTDVRVDDSKTAKIQWF